MGLFEKQFKDIQQMSDDLRAGKISVQEVNAHVGLFSQAEKRMKHMLTYMALQQKLKGPDKRRLMSSNLAGDGQAIEVLGAGPEVEMVKCPGKDFDLIHRHECLDLSGSLTYPECDGCNVGIITKKLLLK